MICSLMFKSQTSSLIFNVNKRNRKSTSLRHTLIRLISYITCISYQHVTCCGLNARRRAGLIHSHKPNPRSAATFLLKIPLIKVIRIWAEMMLSSGILFYWLLTWTLLYKVENVRVWIAIFQNDSWPTDCFYRSLWLKQPLILAHIQIWIRRKTLTLTFS